ncbi:transglutaminase-like domain-containing protein [Methanomicrobium sp. W14]|uniref:transglutaminase-like domain-containing protein n=1 Tax=Methanomicrobium sp. W14 TaxID=2817839 RepID=UPI001AE69E9F|nr:transglutaminase-like domain-containing protein [Methanomicrobium sp. W14]
MMGDKSDYYEILGLDHNATTSDIRKAYRILVKKYHPDVSPLPDALEYFKKINEAYEVLGDPDKKPIYDQSLENKEKGTEDKDNNKDHTFYAHNETLLIDGKNLCIKKSRHLISENQEFVEYKGEYLRFSRELFPFDLNCVDSEYYVDTETVTIENREFVFSNSHHVIVRGQEYIQNGDSYLPFESKNRPKYAGRKKQGGSKSNRPVKNPWNLFKMSAAIIILLVIGYYGALSMNIFENGNNPAENLHGADFPAVSKNISSEDKRAQAIAEAIDPGSQTTKNYALSIRGINSNGIVSIEEVCNIWDIVKGKWTYVQNPGGFGHFSPARDFIRHGMKGDCDDFAIVVASFIEAVGGKSRIVSTNTSEGDGHSYAEAYITNDSRKFDIMSKYILKMYKCNSAAYHIDHDKNNDPQYWLNLDWQSGHPGGEYCNSSGVLTAYYPDGHWCKFNPGKQEKL